MKTGTGIAIAGIWISASATAVAGLGADALWLATIATTVICIFK